jgi:hypothetical protein
MARPRERDYCEECGGWYGDVGPLSRKGLCDKCSGRRMRESVIGPAKREGPGFERWIAGILRYAESSPDLPQRATLPPE